MIARSESDDQIYNYDCMQQLVQACGRGTRHDKDKCVTVITDDAVKNFRWYAKDHATRWFKVLDWKKTGLPGPELLRRAA